MIASVPAPRANAGDIIGFGLILVITNINLLEHHASPSSSAKTTQIGISLLLAVLFATLFATMCIYDINQSFLNLRKIKIAATLLSTASLVFSFAVVQQIAKKPEVKT
jgi:hypothetical protein